MLKLLATGLTIGSGNAGGVFAPSLFLGAILGGLVGTVAHALWPSVAVNPGAYAIVGMYHLLQKYVGASQFKRLLIQLADDLVTLYKGNRSDDWPWFEDVIAYGNAKIPEALLRAYQATQNEEYLEVALESLDFLTKEQWNGVYFDLVGNEGWYPKGGERALFGQQPIDAGYLVEAYVAASEVTNMNKYLELARLAFDWFLGRNDLNVPLYDFKTGGCCDGLQPDGPNRNQGAESTLAWLISLLSVSRLIGERDLTENTVESTDDPEDRQE